MTKSLDTSILVRLCTGTPPKQVEAANNLLQSERQLAIANLAVLETEHVLRTYYQFDRKQVAEAFEYLLWQDNIDCNRAMFSQALHYYLHYPSESFVDCCLAVYADLNDAAPLLTFDKNLANHLPHAKLLPQAS